eukprot:gene11862-22722_t
MELFELPHEILLAILRFLDAQFQDVSCDDALWLTWLQKGWVEREMAAHGLQSPRALYAMLRTAGDTRGFWRITGTPQGGIAFCKASKTTDRKSIMRRGGSSSSSSSSSRIGAVITVEEVAYEPAGFANMLHPQGELVRYAVDCSGGSAAVALPLDHYSAPSTPPEGGNVIAGSLHGIMNRAPIEHAFATILVSVVTARCNNATDVDGGGGGGGGGGAAVWGATSTVKACWVSKQVLSHRNSKPGDMVKIKTEAISCAERSAMESDAGICIGGAVDYLVILHRSTKPKVLERVLFNDPSPLRAPVPAALRQLCGQQYARTAAAAAAAAAASDASGAAPGMAATPNMFAAEYPHHGHEVALMHYLPPGSIDADTSRRLRLGASIGPHGAAGSDAESIRSVPDTASVLVAFKITGDPNVPSGRLTFATELPESIVGHRAYTRAAAIDSTSYLPDLQNIAKQLQASQRAPQANPIGDAASNAPVASENEIGSSDGGADGTPTVADAAVAAGLGGLGVAADALGAAAPQTEGTGGLYPNLSGDRAAAGQQQRSGQQPPPPEQQQQPAGQADPMAGLGSLMSGLFAGMAQSMSAGNSDGGANDAPSMQPGQSQMQPERQGQQQQVDPLAGLFGAASAMADSLGPE